MKPKEADKTKETKEVKKEKTEKKETKKVNKATIKKEIEKMKQTSVNSMHYYLFKLSAM